MSQVKKEASRFLITGVSAVLIDFAFYRLGMFFGLPPAIAKTVSFLTGTVFAYFANRHWTFEAGHLVADWHEIARFVATYGFSLVANVGINAALLAMLGRNEMSIGLAFIIATGVSAILNFLGMKFIVFRPNADETGQS